MINRMQPSDLLRSLEIIGLTQVELARLIDATPRAINYWVMGERAIPGSVAAYLRLLEEAPIEMRRRELGKIFELRKGVSI